METALQRLMASLDRSRPVVIQTHDYPDLDAVACAFALAELLSTQGIRARLTYVGLVLGHSLGETIRLLGIPLVEAGAETWTAEDQFILVDASPSHANVRKLGSGFCAVVDHHPAQGEVQAAFQDVRPQYGSCSTIIAEYYREQEIDPSRRCATALLMGIMMDTAYFTRGVNPADLEAFNFLYFLGDWIQGSFLLKNSLSVQDRLAMAQGLENFRHERGFGFAFMDREVPVDTIALMADDCLRFHEIHLVCVAAWRDGEVKISVRNEDPTLSAGKIVHETLKGIGQGGGHTHMAGGMIPAESFPGADALFQRFWQVVRKSVLYSSGPAGPKESA